MDNKFSKSNSMLEKVLEIVPTASQTFSKSYLQYPEKCSPLFIEKGKGTYVWDIDGNKFLDIVSGLMSNILGYNDEFVSDAIKSQLNKGISFSLPTELEYKLAKLLVDIIPCAEMVRFGKTGTDVTSAAIRLARAFTKRDRVLVCGYHGWQDWYIGTTSRNRGVPSIVANLSDTVAYNDLNTLEEKLKTNEYAAFILEPTNIERPNPGYLEAVRTLTKKHDTVLIFDEVVTGFHFALGGAQEYFNITPDLACFGKGLGNGMPISAVVGKKEIMRLMDDIFFSGTFGGEALSIAAGISVIEKLKSEPVIEHLWNFGEKLSNSVENIIFELGLTNIIKVNGYAPWRILSFYAYKKISANAIKTFFQKQMIEQGILILGSHNINYSMKDKELSIIVAAYEITLAKLKENIDKNVLLSNLNCRVIEPVFKVRE